MEKSLIIKDWDSIDELKRTMSIIKSRIGVLTKEQLCDNLSRNERNSLKFEACFKIFETDISHIYDLYKYDKTEKYYVYAHCDPHHEICVKRDGKSTFAATLGMKYKPFYIGKGCGDRAFDLNRNETHRKIRNRIKKFGKEIDVVLIKRDISELEAYMIESKLIDIFGSTTFHGQLVNLDEGVSNEERKQIYKEQLEILYK